MRNDKLIPFEVIEKAVAGEPESVNAVLQHYTARIKYLSVYNGNFNAEPFPKKRTGKAEKNNAKIRQQRRRE